MTNYAKFGSDEPLEGGSTPIFACNHAKPLSSMFFDQMPTFLTPGKVTGNKKVFSLYPSVQDPALAMSYIVYGWKFTVAYMVPFHSLSSFFACVQKRLRFSIAGN